LTGEGAAFAGTGPSGRVLLDAGFETAREGVESDGQEGRGRQNGKKAKEEKMKRNARIRICSSHLVNLSRVLHEDESRHSGDLQSVSVSWLALERKRGIQKEKDDGKPFARSGEEGDARRTP
jgi:hypothetical protein